MNKSKILSVAIAAVLFASYASAANQNVPANSENCSKAVGMFDGSYEALARKFNKSAKSFEFIRAKWAAGYCQVVIDTPKGPITCLADTLWKMPDGDVGIQLQDNIGSTVSCL